MHRAALAAELHEAALRAEEARAAESRRAVADERRRIAREMHDVVAHSISRHGRAGGRRAPDPRARPGRAPSRPPPQIERTGRETLVEMRRLLGVMRGPGRRRPLSRARRSPASARWSRAPRGAGLPVDPATSRARAAPLPPGLDLGAYRVVEDALDDSCSTAPAAAVRRHGALAAPTRSSSPSTDDRPTPFADGAGPLVGVRERVALYDGELRRPAPGAAATRCTSASRCDDPPRTRPTAVAVQGAA